jgi:hypothetical protein
VLILPSDIQQNTRRFGGLRLVLSYVLVLAGPAWAFFQKHRRVHNMSITITSDPYKWNMF